jgi:UDP-N-acetylglucosamine--N-acetylmuramyl-(pentapeptide) pyrophosphoryl-undecaprenol N-acetylglucosamine transferase
MMADQTIVVAGGGTAGHVYPTLAVVSEILRIAPDTKIAYIGQTGGSEQTIIADAHLENSIEYIHIAAEKLRRYWSYRILILPLAVLRGMFQALGHLRRLRPTVVFCKGGYVCIPVALAAWWLGIPIILHETDASMGLANRLIAPFAVKIAVSFPRPTFLTEKTDRKIVFTGQPVRPVFFQSPARRSTSSNRPVVMVTGSMQGARAINQLIQETLPQLLERYRIIHITGPNDFKSLQSSTQSQFYEPVPYTAKFYDLLVQADVVVSRAGGTIFELAALGKPSILIPLPSAANDHQRHNAAMFAEQDAAVVLEETTLTGELLVQTIGELIRDSKRRASLSRNVRQFARKDAATHLAQLVLEISEQRKAAK